MPPRRWPRRSRALAKATRGVVEHVVVKYRKVIDGIAALMTLPDFTTPTGCRPIQWVSDKLRDLGIISGTVNASSMIARKSGTEHGNPGKTGDGRSRVWPVFVENGEAPRRPWHLLETGP